MIPRFGASVGVAVVVVGTSGKGGRGGVGDGSADVTEPRRAPPSDAVAAPGFGLPAPVPGRSGKSTKLLHEGER